MNNKKIIFGVIWIVGLLAVGFGGYWYFGSEAGAGGVALVESSWDEMIGAPAPDATVVAVATDTESAASDAGDDGSGAASLTPPAPPGPPPAYSIANVGSGSSVQNSSQDGVQSTTQNTTSVTAITNTSSMAIASTTNPKSVAVTASSTSTVVSITNPSPTSTPASVPIPIPMPSSTSGEASTTIATTTQTVPTTTVPATPISPTTTAPTTTTPSSTAAPPAVDHPVIVQVQIAGVASANDFVKIFNPTSAAVDLSGWKLHKKSSTGTDYSLKTFATGQMIAPGAYLTWANSENGFADSIGADVSSSETLSADNSVALLDPSATVIDAVAWGTGVNQYVEGDAYPTSPTASQILVRKSADNVVIDTDDNASDFTIQ